MKKHIGMKKDTSPISFNQNNEKKWQRFEKIIETEAIIIVRVEVTVK
jgi:hypothetical protein